MPTCPSCDGSRRTFAHVNRGGVGSGFEWIDCFTCRGVGHVSVEQQRWIDDGCRARDMRISFDLSIREAAKLIGIRPAEISDMETGRRDPLQLLAALDRHHDLLLAESGS